MVSCQWAFPVLLEEKRQKFCDPVQSLLPSNVTDVNTLHRLLGKCISFSLAVPDARLFLNEINLAISRGARWTRPIHISSPLKSEIAVDVFGILERLPTLAQRVPSLIILCADASSFAWGGVFGAEAQSVSIYDYRPSSRRHLAPRDLTSLRIYPIAPLFFFFATCMFSRQILLYQKSCVLSHVTAFHALLLFRT